MPAPNQEHDFSFHRIDVRSPELVDLIARRRPEVDLPPRGAGRRARLRRTRPTFDAEVNILGTLHVLEGARAAETAKVVFAASGGTLYGEPAELPVQESAPHRPLSPYGVSKKAAIDYLAAYRELYDLEFTALALSNVYGPRQDPHGEAGVVAIFAGRLLRGEPCTIFGDGRQTRDFVFVDDVVDAFARGRVTRWRPAAEHRDGRRDVGQRPLWGDGGRRRRRPPRAVCARRDGELERSALDPGRAGIHLGWRPWTTVAEGVGEATLAWFAERVPARRRPCPNAVKVQAEPFTAPAVEVRQLGDRSSSSRTATVNQPCSLLQANVTPCHKVSQRVTAPLLRGVG